MKDSEYILLEDDLGNTQKFAVVDVLEYQGSEYVILLPDDEDANEFMILLIDTDSSGEEIYVGIDDDSLVEEVFEVFKEKHEI